MNSDLGMERVFSRPLPLAAGRGGLIRRRMPACECRQGGCGQGRLLASIEAALGRLEAGGYGFCLGCGTAMDLARLTVNPAETHCQSCAPACRCGAARSSGPDA